MVNFQDLIVRDYNMASHIKKGDIVQVIAGDNKGKTGKVMKVIKDKTKISRGMHQFLVPLLL